MWTFIATIGGSLLQPFPITIEKPKREEIRRPRQHQPEPEEENIGHGMEMELLKWTTDQPDVIWPQEGRPGMMEDNLEHTSLEYDVRDGDLGGVKLTVKAQNIMIEYDLYTKTKTEVYFGTTQCRPVAILLYKQLRYDRITTREEKEAGFRKRQDEKKLVPRVHMVQPGDPRWEKDRERTKGERFEDRIWQKDFEKRHLREEETNEREMERQEDLRFEDEANRKYYGHFMDKQDRRQRRCAIWRRLNSRGARKGRVDPRMDQED